MNAIIYSVFMVILVCYSVADNMGDFCLQKSVAFIDQFNKCSFTKKEAEAFFNRDSNMNQCQRKCRVDILGYSDLSYPYSYRVEELQLTIAGFRLTHTICPFSYTTYKRILNITCSSWTQDVHAFWNEGNCELRNCTSISNTCICSCPPGYSLFNGLCLPKSVTVNNPCVYSWQCTGTEFSTVCSKGTCECQHGYLSLNGACYRDNVVVGGACVFKEQCKGTEHSGVCSNGACACETGYISIHQKCYEGNLSLDNQCLFNAQCSGSPTVSCRDGNCTCIEGYEPDKTSKCILRLQTSDKEAFIADQRDMFKLSIIESSLGSTLGALFGGVLLGVLITIMITGFIIYKRSQQNYIKCQKEEHQVVFLQNNAYGDARSERSANNDSRSNKSNQRKTVFVSPYPPPDESPEYGNVSKTSRTNRANEDIYNHLNEKEIPDDDDNYDHACAATGHRRGNFDSDYSSMRDVDKGYGTSV